MIHCQKCKHENAPSALKCRQCGTNLLPGTGVGERLGILGCSIIIAGISLALVFLVFIKTDIKLMLGVILFGVLMLGFGFFWSISKMPLYERYEARAKRHVSLDPQQAIADYTSAIDLTPKVKAIDFLRERAKLYQNQGLIEAAKTDWQYILENINKRMAKSKTPVIDLIKERADIY
jgi:tetratricopeptide (TPR) repeat protein